MKLRRKRYVHYGQSEYDNEKEWVYADLSWVNKPPVGFWGSPVNTYYGWKEWCQDNDFHVGKLYSRFYFRLKAHARILKVRRLKDIEKYLIDTHDKVLLFRYKIDFRKIMKYYDGIELIHSAKTYWELHSSVFNMWDCDSIVIWNKNCIVPD